MSTAKRYFSSAMVVTVIGLALGAVIGYASTGTVGGALSALFIVGVLSVLEISLSFDNAVVNASVVKEMDAVWRRRFLTWGILVAVFGMRVLFPLVIVAIAAHLGPIEALLLAIGHPEEYERIMTGAHIAIASFGGTFLFMVGLAYFFDPEKDIHWLSWIERPLSRFAHVEAVEIGVVLLTLYGVSRVLPEHEVATFLVAGIFGLIVFIAVEAIGALFEVPKDQVQAVHRTGFAAFLYLEVLDASFSLDGVIAAFALSNNLFIIALGLGIGAMYVRSTTIMLVDLGSLARYPYLEHGAFWAILALAIIMYLQTFMHVPEVITGMIGATLIGGSFIASIYKNRREEREGRS